MTFKTAEILEVRKEKDKFKDSKDLSKAIKLLSEKIYNDDIHFVLELIQNAEDEGSQEIIIYVDSNQVVVSNDGKPFDKNDLEAICSIGGGRKKENKIGFMGIGFKSVFRISDRPQVVSGDYSFIIQDFLYPSPSKHVENSSLFHQPLNGAVFILPLKEEYKNNITNLVSELAEVDEKILLFLSSLKKVTFIDNSEGEERIWSYSKSVEAATVSLRRSDKSKPQLWTIFSKPVDIKDRALVKDIKEKKDLKKTVVTVAFPAPDITEIQKCKKNPLYCFLPTEVSAQLPFLLQADFTPTAGRGDIDTKSDWNTWLLGCLAEHVAHCVDKIKVDRRYLEYLYDFIPLPDLYHHEHLKEKFLLPFIEKLKSHPIVFGKDSSWHHVETATLVESELDSLIGVNESRIIYGEDVIPFETAQFTDHSIKVLELLGIRSVGLDLIPDLFSERLDTKTQGVNWFIEMYYYLASKWQLFDSWRRPEVFDELRRTPFLLAHDFALVPPSVDTDDDRLVTYHPKGENLGILPKIFEDGEIVFLHKGLSVDKRKTHDVKRARIVEFFVEEYGVSKFIDPHKIINDVILPKFESRKHEEFSPKKLVILTNYIRENVRFWINKKKGARSRAISEDEIYRELGSKILFKAEYSKSGPVKETFMPPNLLYIGGRSKSRSDIFSMMSALEEVPFISQDYYKSHFVQGYSKADMVNRGRYKKSITWDAFFGKLGAWSTPRVIESMPVNIARYSASWRFISQLPGEANDQGYTISSDWVMPEFEKIIKVYNRKPRVGKRLLNLLRDQLRNNWAVYAPYKTTTIEWHYRGFHSQDVPGSTFLYELQKTNWYFPERGAPRSPEEFYLYSDLNELILPEESLFVSDNRNRTFYRDIGINSNPTTETVWAYYTEIKKSWKKNDFPRNWSNIITNMYDFLAKSESEIESSFISRLKRSNSIFYPTAIKNWWKHDQVFWNDHASTFQTRRIYLKSTYPVEARNILAKIGVKLDPTIGDYIDAIVEERDSLGSGKLGIEVVQFLHGAYVKIAELLDGEDAYYDDRLYENLYLDRNLNFCTPDDIYYLDNEWYEKLRDSSFKLLHLRHPYQLYERLFEKAGIKPISTRFSLKPVFTESEIDRKNEFGHITSIDKYLKPYINYHYPDLLEKYKLELDSINSLRVVSVHDLSLDFTSTQSKKVIENYQGADVFLDINKHENVLLVDDEYISLQDLADECTLELYRLISGLEKNDIKSYMREIIGSYSDEEKRVVMHKHGIPEALFDQTLETKTLELIKGQRMKKSPRVAKTVESEIIIGDGEPENEREVISNRGETEYTSLSDITHMRTEDTSNQESKSVKSVEIIASPLKKPIRKPNKRKVEISSTTSALTTEAHAINAVLYYERREGREALDVHDQKKLGYDMISADRHIEVKSFTKGNGPLSLTQYEYRAAQKLKNNYYIYVVSQLTTDHDSIRIEIIQNPIDSIELHVPGNRIANQYTGQTVVHLSRKNKDESK